MLRRFLDFISFLWILLVCAFGYFIDSVSLFIKFVLKKKVI